MGALCARTHKSVYIIADRLSSNIDWSGFGVLFFFLSLFPSNSHPLVLSYISPTQPITPLVPLGGLLPDVRFQRAVQNVALATKKFLCLSGKIHVHACKFSYGSARISKVKSLQKQAVSDAFKPQPPKSPKRGRLSAFGGAERFSALFFGSLASPNGESSTAQAGNPPAGCRNTTPTGRKPKA